MAARRRPRVFDTNIYIAAIRSGDRRIWQRFAAPDVWLSMIVVFELRAGARSVVEFRQLQRLVDASRRRDRLLVPTEQEWLTAAQIVRHYAGRLGALNPWTHVGDVLILLGAARVGGEVVTQNLQDFNRWALELRAAGQDVGVSDRL